MAKVKRMPRCRWTPASRAAAATRSFIADGYSYIRRKPSPSISTSSGEPTVSRREERRVLGRQRRAEVAAREGEHALLVGLLGAGREQDDADAVGRTGGAAVAAQPPRDLQQHRDAAEVVVGAGHDRLADHVAPSRRRGAAATRCRPRRVLRRRISRAEGHERRAAEDQAHERRPPVGLLHQRMSSPTTNRVTVWSKMNDVRAASWWAWTTSVWAASAGPNSAITLVVCRRLRKRRSVRLRAAGEVLPQPGAPRPPRARRRPRAGRPAPRCRPARPTALRTPSGVKYVPWTSSSSTRTRARRAASQRSRDPRRGLGLAGRAGQAVDRGEMRHVGVQRRLASGSRTSAPQRTERRDG